MTQASAVRVVSPGHTSDDDVDLQSYVSIAQESLLGHAPSIWPLYLDRVGRENVRLVRVDDRIVGGLAFYRMSHVFGREAVGAAGISGVAIDPVVRGSQVCATMLKTTLRELHDEGMPIASLYASTQHPYRSVGFEQAGSRFDYTLPLRCLPRPNRSLACHRCEHAPLAAMRDVHRSQADETNGNLVRTDGLWERLLRPYDGKRCVTYLFGDRENPAGYAILKQAGRDAGVPAELVVTDYAVNTAAALDRLMSLLHDHRSMFDRVRWCGGPQDALLAAASEHWVTVHEMSRWMVRILNVPAALLSRGYPPTLSGEVRLVIEDDLLADNAGVWRLAWTNGSIEVERIAAELPDHASLARVDVRYLVPLYSSFLTAGQLRQFGHLRSGSRHDIDVLDAAFAGPSPWLPEYF